MQLNFAFKPTAVGEFDEEMLVEYDSGETCYARLTGAAAEVDVALERSLLTLDACYISLVSQSAIRLHNRSDIRVSFSWRQFESAAAEAQAKMVSLANLQLDGGLGASLARQRRRAIELDPLPFSHDVFAIEPSDGEIFPGCYCELTVVFKPETAGDINAVAFCEVNGRDARLPLRLQGKGLGPKATWLYDSLDVGDVFIHSTHRYEVVLENHGEIGTEYGVQARGPLPPPTGLFHSHPTASPPHLSDPPSDSLLQMHESDFTSADPDRSMFRFSPAGGRLEPKQQVQIEVEFCSHLLGEFSETFRWTLQGQPQPLPLQVKGRVVGPSFHFSEGGAKGAVPLEGIDFGVVSLGFLQSKEFSLHNTSEVPMRFKLLAVT